MKMYFLLSIKIKYMIVSKSKYKKFIVLVQEVNITFSFLFFLLLYLVVRAFVTTAWSPTRILHDLLYCLNFLYVFDWLFQARIDSFWDSDGPRFFYGLGVILVDWTFRLLSRIFESSLE